MFGCVTRGWSQVGFRVMIVCPGRDGLPESWVLMDTVSGDARLFQSLDEAVLAAQEQLAELEDGGRLCYARIAFYASMYYPVLIVTDSDGTYKLEAESCIKLNATHQEK